MTENRFSGHLGYIAHQEITLSLIIKRKESEATESCKMDLVPMIIS